MANITASMVKELRERTGLGMMDCKKALVAAEGNIEKAIEDLRKNSALKAEKKSSRIAAEGIVLTKIAEDGNYGVVIEVNSETDFAARDENFLGFAEDALELAFCNSDADVGSLLAKGLEAERQALVQKIGENINLRRVDRLKFENADEGIVESYVHSNNKIVPEDVLMRESEIYSAQARESGKPEEIVEKMIGGRLRKFITEVTLFEQPFVKDPDTKISDLLREAGADIVNFVRYEVGEGIDKEELDFAKEVAAQANT